MSPFFSLDNRILLDALEKLPNATIIWNVEVVDLKQTAEQVTIFTKNVNTGEETQLSADYCCGCDGGRGKIRKFVGQCVSEMLSFPFPLVHTHNAYSAQELEWPHLGQSGRGDKRRVSL